MTIINKIIILILLSLLSVIVIANPGNGNHSNDDSNPLFFQNHKGNGPPAHAKAWGRKYDWKNMSKSQRKQLQSNNNQQNSADVTDKAKAIGRILLN